MRRRRRRRARPVPGAGVRGPGEDRAGPGGLPAGQRGDLLLRHRRRAGRDDLAGHDRHQPHRGLPRDARGAADHDRPEVRPDRGHVVDGGQAGLPQRGPLRRGEVGRDRAGQVGGDRGGGARDHGQRDLPDQRGHSHDPEPGGLQAVPPRRGEPDVGGGRARVPVAEPDPVPWVEPIDISNAMAFLCSDEARYITGETLAVAAGFNASNAGGGGRHGGTARRKGRLHHRGGARAGPLARAAAGAGGRRHHRVDLCGQVGTVQYAMATPEDLAETAKEVEDLDRRIVARQADVRDTRGLQEASTRASPSSAASTSSCANAGIANRSAANAWTRTTTAGRTIIDINLTGVCNTVRVAVPRDDRTRATAARSSSPARTGRASRDGGHRATTRPPSTASSA